ncbi:DUF3526 domain-containing protein [Tolypothrix campylonemoides VB511288]|nr:DUF3526 domain-containing protein [Tolypothrix campylonemoides VB511288]
MLIALLALAALLLAREQVRAYERDRAVAERQDRATWLDQGERNPHGAAHFSAWAFRPLTAMALLEPGITPHAGSAIWMEAHSQDPAAARPAEDRAGTLDLGTFSLAWVVQVLAPLLVGVLAAGLVARERERGTLRLMLASGAPPGALVAMKARALGALVALVFAPLLLVAAIAVAMAPVPVDADTLQRLALWLLAHAAYLAIAVCLAVALSARVRSVDRALLLWVGGWTLAVLIAPRLGATLSDAVAPLPTAREFWADVRAELGEADVFDPESPATKALQARTMARYGVSRMEDLPVNFAGIQLDEAERHGNTVFDRAYGELHAREDRQRALMRAASVLSPLPAMQNVSAGLAGTDTAHQRAFAAQAEAHRRLTVGMLNGDMIRNAGRADYDYKAGPAFWATIPQFAYRAPGWRAHARAWAVDALVLAGWLLLSVVLLRGAGRALAKEAA